MTSGSNVSRDSTDFRDKLMHQTVAPLGARWGCLFTPTAE
jgi:hypothetical protein